MIDLLVNVNIEIKQRWFVIVDVYYQVFLNMIHMNII